eukprot:g71998.t1
MEGGSSEVPVSSKPNLLEEQDEEEPHELPSKNLSINVSSSATTIRRAAPSPSVVVRNILQRAKSPSNRTSSPSASMVLPTSQFLTKLTNASVAGVKTVGNRISKIRNASKTKISKHRVSYVSVEAVTISGRRKRGRNHVVAGRCVPLHSLKQIEEDDANIVQKEEKVSNIHEHQRKKTDEEMKLLLTAMEQTALEEHSQQAAVVRGMWRLEMRKGSVELFYPTETKQGNLLTNHHEDVAQTAGKEEILDILRPGACINELALQHEAHRRSGARAVTHCVLFAIRTTEVRARLAAHDREEQGSKIAVLKKVALLSKLKPTERTFLAEVMTELTVSPGTEVVRQGEEGAIFYMVAQGELSVTVLDSETGQKLQVKELKEGDYFGEMALLKKEKRAATVTAVTPVVCFALSEQAFLSVLGSCSAALHAGRLGEEYSEALSRSRSNSGVARPSSQDSEPEPKWGREPSLEAIDEAHSEGLAKVDIKSLSELTVLGTLGRGAFGHVQLVRDKAGTVHALKTLNKHLLVEMFQVEHVQNEKNIMNALHHPFIIQFRGWFQDANHLHFFMEPSLGGELATELEEREVFSGTEAKFVAACLILTLEYMHNKGIIYRDLKPENILLGPNGYLKVVDFGFAKNVGEGRSFSMCGTPEYLSPEMIKGKGHGFATDYWSLGIVIYKLLTGDVPWSDDNPMGTYQLVMQSKGVPWPEGVEVAKDALEVVEGLLHKEAPLRLGVAGGSSSSLRQHPWFADVNWQHLLVGTATSPFKVDVASNTDLSNFEDYLGEDDRWQDFALEEGQPDPFANF